jgi:hypothetical protein
MKKKYPGVNIQWPITMDILSGKKTIETRTYPLPKKYLGKPIAIIETPGKHGEFKARVVALVIFDKNIAYNGSKEFYRDSDKHLVTRESIWAWQKGKKKWGWRVKEIRILRNPINAPSPRGIVFARGCEVEL